MLLAAAVGLAVAVTAAPVCAGGEEEVPVPEMGPGVLAGALTLLTGGALLIRDRFRGR